MKLIALFAITTLLSLSACIPVISGKSSKNSKPADVLSEDGYSSSASIGPVFIANSKPASRKISGRIYCGEGMRQVPANRATVEIKNKNKVTATASTETDGSFAMKATFELEGDYTYAIKGRCGQLFAKVPNLTSDLTNQDFWIK